MIDELARLPSPTVLVIEDAHWADSATLDVLRHVARRISELPAVLILTYRDADVGLNHPLRGLLGGLAGAERLPLRTLSAGAVTELAADSAVDADALFRLTDGNPFFVTEVLASPELSVPPTVADAVLARVGKLSPRAQAALEYLAVAPTGFEMPVLSELVDEMTPIAEAERSGVLRMRGNIVRIPARTGTPRGVRVNACERAAGPPRRRSAVAVRPCGFRSVPGTAPRSGCWRRGGHRSVWHEGGARGVAGRLASPGSAVLRPGLEAQDSYSR